MKKTLLGLSLIAMALVGKAQNCSDLIISKYVEGTSNNKALELYNSSSSVISLANYRIIRWDNGSTAFTATEGELQLPTNITLQPYQTYVIALNLTDPNGTGQSAPIDLALQAKADTLLCPGCATGTGNSRVLCFNGDDALSLEKNTGGGNWVKVDIFACIGERPSNSGGTFSPTAGWTSIAPYESIPANYSSNYPGVPYFFQYWTQDKILIRKSTVKTGVTTNPAYQTFNPSVQWDSIAPNTYSVLGTHNCDCQVVGVKEISKTFDFIIYPNPSNDLIQISSSAKIIKASFYNVMGEEVKEIKFNKSISENIIDISGFSAGIYSVIVIDDRNNSSVNKFIKD
jgi:hypothetical protein